MHWAWIKHLLMQLKGSGLLLLCTFILSFLRYSCKVIKRKTTWSGLTNVKWKHWDEIPSVTWGKIWLHRGHSSLRFNLDKFHISLLPKTYDLLWLLLHFGKVPHWDVPISDPPRAAYSNVHGQKVQNKKIYTCFVVSSLCSSEDKGGKILAISLMVSFDNLR